MGVQTKILRRKFESGTAKCLVPTKDEAGNITGYEEVTKEYTSGSGTLIGGTPGQIYDVAYGPVCHTTNLAEAADIGSFVAGSGVIVNAPEYALYGTAGNPLAPTLTLPAGMVVSVMTAGHIWVQRSALAAIKEGMNTYVIYEPEGEGEADLCIVEVNGLKEAAEGTAEPTAEDSNADEGQEG